MWWSPASIPKAHTEFAEYSDRDEEYWFEDDELFDEDEYYEEQPQEWMPGPDDAFPRQIRIFHHVAGMYPGMSDWNIFYRKTPRRIIMLLVEWINHRYKHGPINHMQGAVLHAIMQGKGVDPYKEK